jgi:hypothetical protein
MTTPFFTYFHLLRGAVQQQLASQVEEGLPPPIVAALLKAGLLAQGPSATEYPCINAGFACPRRVIAYRGPRPDLYCARAVPPEQNSCCSSENLTPEQIRTYVADERSLIERLCSWSGADHAMDAHAARKDALVRIGYLQTQGAPLRVFLARRISTKLARARLLDLETTGPALVIALMRDEDVSAEFEERYSGRSAVRVLFLEDYLRVEADTLLFAPLDLASSWNAPRDRAPSGGPLLRVLTHRGETTITQQAAEALRARTDLHLFVDFTATARGGGAKGYKLVEAPDGSPMRCDFVLNINQAHALQEYVRAKGRPIAPKRLECVRAAGIGNAMRLVQKLAKIVDLSSGRDQHRAFQSHKDLVGRVSEYSFSPPADFDMALLLPAAP